jgi:predicted Zn-dependent protease
MTKLTTAFALLSFLFLITACEKTPDKIISINPNEFTIEDQVVIGEAFKTAIENNGQDFTILDKNDYPQAYDYVEQLLFTMVNTAPVARRRDFDWSLGILHNDSFRTAFFLPGGHFFIYTGLLKYLESESELLGVIGHELYYTDTDLMVKRMGKAFTNTKLGDVLLGNEVPNIGELATEIPALNFENQDVMKADSFSVEIICPFQYESLGLQNVLKKAEETEPALDWLDIRLAPSGARMDNIERLAGKCGLPGVVNESAYQKFKTTYLPQ